MRDDGNALLRSVLETPADDAPRLVYADWLDENGHEKRAKFIRDQIRHYRAGDTTSLSSELGRRRQSRGRWHVLAGTPVWDLDLGRVTVPTTVILRNTGTSVVGFERGFAAWASIPWGEWSPNTQQAFARHPIASVQMNQIIVVPWRNSFSNEWGFQGPGGWMPARVGITPGPYPSALAARMALARALVNAGRKRAGLSELP